MSTTAPPVLLGDGSWIWMWAGQDQTGMGAESLRRYQLARPMLLRSDAIGVLFMGRFLVPRLFCS